MPQSMLYYLEFEHLLSGVTTSKEEDAMISSGKTSTKPTTPPPDSHLITAQVEGSTLTTAQYNCILGLTCSLLHVSTSDLVYDGHTVNPLTLHWHSPATVKIYNSFFLCAEMALEGIKSVHVDFRPVFDALRENVRTKNLYYVVHIIVFVIRRKSGLLLLHGMGIYWLSRIRLSLGCLLTSEHR